MPPTPARIDAEPPDDSTEVRARVRRAVATALGRIASLAVLAGCGADAPHGDARGDDIPAYAVSAAPTLALEDDGTPEQLFGRVDARRLADGSLVVGDKESGTIHVFDRDGTIVRRVARRGDGPGELRGEFALAVRGDTVLAFGRPPSGTNDVHVFEASGRFLRRFRPEAPGAPAVTALDALAGGALLVRRGMGFRAFHTVPAVGTLVPDSIELGMMRVAGDSAAVATTWLPAMAQAPLVAFPWVGSRIGVSMAPYRFAARTIAVASGDRVWLVDSDSGGLRAFDVDGRTVATARLPLAPEPFDERALATARESELAAAERPRDSARVVATYDPAHRPAAMPVASAAYAGPDGEVWVRLFALDSAGPQRFVVVDHDGATIARATLPAGLAIHQIGRDFVLGVRRDSLGVESVHEYAVRRP